MPNHMTFNEYSALAKAANMAKEANNDRDIQVARSFCQ